MSNLLDIKTVGDLKKSGYQSLSIADEMRKNLSDKLKKGENTFEGIIGYENTVIPELERAILAGHSINFLGLRGQGKTKMARLLVQLLDEYIPILKNSPLNEDPLAPISNVGKKIIEEEGDQAAIAWMHRSERYSEKLATPDVNIADLIGDVDPIKAANLKLSLDNEEVINYGIIPRSNRGIFVINELPDLQPRIQVALFNLLQEGDLQLRGYKVRIPMDVQFVFTSNPEDYTNRGSIITPLKDRIQSQIFTHYPLTNELSRSITKQEVKIKKGQENIIVPELIEELIEQIAIEARASEFVDGKSGVSARLSIAAYENVVSAVERRMLISGDTEGTARIEDLKAAIPGIIGKIEMVYEGEQEGVTNVAHRLIGQAIRTIATTYFGEFDLINNLNKVPKELKERFKTILDWFESGHGIEISESLSEEAYHDTLFEVEGLADIIPNEISTDRDQLVTMEFVLHALGEFSMLNKKSLKTKVTFNDYFNSVMNGL